MINWPIAKALCDFYLSLQVIFTKKGILSLEKVLQNLALVRNVCQVLVGLVILDMQINLTNPLQNSLSGMVFCVLKLIFLYITRFLQYPATWITRCREINPWEVREIIKLRGLSKFTPNLCRYPWNSAHGKYPNLSSIISG